MRRRFLHDIVSVGGGLEEAVRKRMGMSRLRSLAARRQPEVVIEVALRHATSGTQWEYELSLTQGKDQRPRIKHERIVKDGKVLVNRPDDKDTQDPERLTQTYLQQVNVNREFREVADFFAAIRYLHIVPQLVRERWRCHWRARSCSRAPSPSSSCRRSCHLPRACASGRVLSERPPRRPKDLHCSHLGDT
jgi:hypothetical protein